MLLVFPSHRDYNFFSSLASLLQLATWYFLFISSYDTPNWEVLANASLIVSLFGISVSLIIKFINLFSPFSRGSNPRSSLSF